MLVGPAREEVFLREVEVGVGHAVGGETFGLGDCGGTEVDAIVFAARLEEEAFWDDRGDGES